jgi:hypothetical protein
MFGVDMAAVAGSDTARYAELRARAKTINFGIVYGQGAAALGRSLSLAGSPTTTAEAQLLLDAYLAAYPRVAAWLVAQDAVVDEMAARVADVDWELTLRLHDELVPLTAYRRAFRDEHRRWPSRREVLETHPDVAPWMLRFEDPVVLLRGGRPLRWSSRTLAGRRRQFTIGTSAMLRRAGLRAAASEDPALIEARTRFAGRHHVELSGVDAAGRTFEDRALRRAFVGWLWKELGDGPTVELLVRATTDAVRGAGNAFRNAPIQGGVADAMLGAYGELWTAIGSDGDLLPAVTVHDSLAVECPLDRADEVAAALVEALRRGFARWCTDVPLAVDVDVRTSLSDSDVTRTFPPSAFPDAGRAGGGAGPEERS